MNDTTDPLMAAAESLLIQPEAPEETAQDDQTVDAEMQEEETATDDAAGDEAETPEEGDVDESDEEEGQEEEAPSTFTVKVDGKDVEVTLQDLMRSYSGDAYIQKGMREAAEAKKEAARVFEALQTEQAKFLQAVQTVQQQGFIAPPTPPDIAMSRTDPIGYLQAKAEYDQQANAYQAQQAQIQQVSAQQKALQDQARAQFLAEQKRLLAERLPDLADPVKAPEVTRKIRQVGMDAYGFSEEELGAVIDARHVQVLHDAMKWRELQSGKAQPKKAEPPKTLKPKAKLPQPQGLQRQRQIQTALKTGDLRSIATAALLIPEG